jgi:hypothetical protein
MPFQILKNYINLTYPHLTSLLTEKQYEQIDWIDTSYQTNERIPENEPKIHLHQQRIFARLHFLFLLRQGEVVSYHRFVNGQKEPKLSAEHFTELSKTITQLSEAEYQQLWIATLTSKSTEANRLAAELLKENPPFDAADFLAKVMSQIPEIYPAAAELLTQDQYAKAGFSAMFDTGHFRHMMYVEGGPKMFSKLRDKIQNKMQKKELNLWFAYWLIDITGFRAQTKELGSEYFNDNTYKAVVVLKSHLDKLFAEPQRAILYDYLNDRAKWLGLIEASSSSNAFLSGTNLEIPRLILARIAAMQRLFTPEEKEGLQRGLLRLMEKLGDENYKKLLETLNPLQVTDEPTPTFGPALLANLRAERNYEDSIVIGLPVYAKALEQYRKQREENKIEKNIPLNLNGLAGIDNIRALLRGEEVLVSVNVSDGTTKLTSAALKNKLDVSATQTTSMLM